MGKWKLNVAKSTFTPGPGWRSQTRIYRGDAGRGAVSWTGVGAHGETMHVSYEYSYDGKDYPMVGSANYERERGAGRRLHREVGREARRQDRRLAMRRVSADGKVLTITDEGTNRKGEKFCKCWCSTGSEGGGRRGSGGPSL